MGFDPPTFGVNRGDWNMLYVMEFVMLYEVMSSVCCYIVGDRVGVLFWSGVCHSTVVSRLS